MITLSDNSIIYILCPSKVFTGGPLALHQLAFILRKNGYNAVILYSPEIEEPTSIHFSRYKIPYTFSIEDNQSHVIIIPEVMTDYAHNLHNIRKAIWWLSVDNFFKDRLSNKLLRHFGLTNKFRFKYANDFFHFTQSFYAYQFLAKKRIDKNRIYMLSDYLLEDYLMLESNCLRDKKDNVLYNPKKGFKFTQRIIERSKHLFNWIPIENMSPAQVKDLLLSSKVYIDFGNHPGKDRFPREAIMCGCCLITGKKGSAKHFEDVPIPEEFKFKMKNSDISSIISKIQQILHEYDKTVKIFQPYQEKIKLQPKIFENEVNSIFINESSQSI